MPQKLKIGINGFGRIGRVVARLALQRSDIELAGINDLCRPEQMVHLFKYDSVHGRMKQEIRLEGGFLIAADERGVSRIRLSAEKDPARLSWADLGAQVIHECTGVLTEKAQCALHLKAGASRVIISAPSKDADVTLCMGVNENSYDPVRHSVVSNASCTTNCLAPICKILNDRFGLVRGTMMTVHAYTNDQNVLDFPHRDLRRARAAGLSMIPTTTGAAKALALVLPELKGKVEGLSIRVPTPNVSILDLTCELQRRTTRDELNAVFRSAADGALKGILGYSEEPLVSVDYNGCENSSTIDAESTMVLDGNFVKVLSWYDNETGFSSRMLDLTAYMQKRGI